MGEQKELADIIDVHYGSWWGSESFEVYLTYLDILGQIVFVSFFFSFLPFFLFPFFQFKSSAWTEMRLLHVLLTISFVFSFLFSKLNSHVKSGLRVCAVGWQLEGVQFLCELRRLISYCQDWLQAPLPVISSFSRHKSLLNIAAWCSCRNRLSSELSVKSDPL